MSAMTWACEQPQYTFRAELLPMAKVKPRPVDWVWPRYLAAGTVATLSGESGSGKTYLALAIAAALTNGKLPDNSRRRRAQDVLYLNGDDSPSQALRPRFDALGGDPRRLHLLHYALVQAAEAAACSASTSRADEFTPEECAAAEEGFQRLLSAGDAKGMTPEQLAAVDPARYCDLDKCSSCTKCQDFSRLVMSAGYSQDDIDQVEEEEDEISDTDGEKDRQPDALQVAMEMLAEALRQTKAQLLIVDSLDSLLEAAEFARPRNRYGIGDGDGRTDRQSSPEERARALRMLADRFAALARDHNCCVLLVRQLKARGRGRPSRRDTRTIEVAGTTELLAGYAREDATQRVLVQTRSKLGPLAPPLGYVIQEDGKLCWTGESDESAPEISVPMAGAEQQHAVREAKDFLRATLNQGRVAALEVLQQARRLGISARTLRRAKALLQVASERRDDGTWRWFMPS
jgi:hypothetical protein